MRLIFLFFLLSIFINVTAQNDYWTTYYAGKIMEKTGIIEQINSEFTNQKNIYLKFFYKKIADKNLSVNDSLSILNKINHLIQFQKKELINQLVYSEKQNGLKQLKRDWKKIEKNKDFLVLKHKTFQKEVKTYVQREFLDFQNKVLPRLIANLQKNRELIPLRFYVNNQLVEIPKDLKIYLLQKNSEKLLLLDSLNKGIKKNMIKNFQDIYGLEVIYKNKKFILLPDKKANKMPGNFRRERNFLSKINFINNDPWNIYITETDDNILLELENTSLVKSTQSKH